MREEAVSEEKEKNYSTPLNKNPRKTVTMATIKTAANYCKPKQLRTDLRGVITKVQQCPLRTVGEIYII